MCLLKISDKCTKIHFLIIDVIYNLILKAFKQYYNSVDSKLWDSFFMFAKKVINLFYSFFAVIALRLSLSHHYIVWFDAEIWFGFINILGMIWLSCMSSVVTRWGWFCHFMKIIKQELLWQRRHIFIMLGMHIFADCIFQS